MILKIEIHNYHHESKDYRELIRLVEKGFRNMSEKGQAIIAELDRLKANQEEFKEDILELKDLVDNAGTNPTAEEWETISQKVTEAADFARSAADVVPEPEVE